MQTPLQKQIEALEQWQTEEILSKPVLIIGENVQKCPVCGEPLSFRDYYFCRNCPWNGSLSRKE